VGDDDRTPRRGHPRDLGEERDHVEKDDQVEGAVGERESRGVGDLEADAAVQLGGEQFTPFLKSLKDIESYLALDLSPTGIKAMGDLAKQARDNGDKVKSSIDAVLVQVNSVRGMLSTR